MKYFLTIFVLFFLMCSTPALALDSGHIYLPNGNILDARGLTDEEIAQAVDVAVKSMQIKKTEAVVSAVEKIGNLDPESLDQWRKLITGTIKDVCDDLSITVNDFVKTPVGFGIAALIVYRVAGEDLLDNAIDFVIMVPLWCFVTATLLFFAWYFYSMKTIYDIKYDKDTGKRVEKKPIRVERYHWEKSVNREGLAWIMGILWLILTIISLLIVLV